MQRTDGKMVSLRGLDTSSVWTDTGQAELSLPLLQSFPTSGPDARIIFPLTKE